MLPASYDVILTRWQTCFGFEAGSRAPVRVLPLDPDLAAFLIGHPMDRVRGGHLAVLRWARVEQAFEFSSDVQSAASAVHLDSMAERSKALE